jgi:hypothetical protein
MIAPEELKAIGFKLIALCKATGATQFKLSMDNVTDPEGPLGDWEMTVRKKGVPEWIIWSNEHGAYWGRNRSGYIKSRKDAGKYSYEDALEIVEGANKYRKDDEEPFEAMIYSPNETAEV